MKIYSLSIIIDEDDEVVEMEEGYEEVRTSDVIETTSVEDMILIEECDFDGVARA